MVFNQNIIIYFSLFNFIITLKLNVNKNYVNENQLLIFNNLYNKSQSNHTSLRTLINLSLQKEKIGLYSINIKLGNPKQEFSLILDSGSSYIWTYDNSCDSCKSNNKYIPDESKTFLRSKETIKMNYISGKNKGNICQDTLEISQNISISSFYFLLVYESNIDFELDGIIGLSKGSINKKYSFLKQLKEKKIIKNNILLYDLFNKSFYIDEIPQLYLEQKSISCKDINDKSNLWKCNLNNIKINSIPITMETEIVFDSGTNGIIFPMKYKEFFENIIKNNPLFQKNKCEFQYFKNDQVYELVCINEIKYSQINTSEYFLEFYLDKGKNNFFGIKLTDLFGEDNKTFYLFILERKKKEIVLGAPFFEKYPILFNLEENLINIFGVGSNLYKYNRNSNYKIETIHIIIIIIIIFIIFLILLRIYCLYRRKISQNQFEFRVSEIR